MVAPTASATALWKARTPRRCPTAPRSWSSAAGRPLRSSPSALSGARDLGKTLDLTIPERKAEVCFYQPLRQLGRFGDADRGYFTPWFIKVRRTKGDANQVGSVVSYQVTPSFLSFSAVLEKVVEGRYLLYRVMDGFARDGLLVFDIDPLRPGVNLLTIYVGFDFPRGSGRIGKLGWRLGRAIFPRFVHDVVWNHSLCQMKDLTESDGGG